MDVELTKRWRATEVVLERARVALPQPGPEVQKRFDQVTSEYHEYVSHNELGLALEALRDAAALVSSRGGVWRDLIRAAELMELTALIPELQSRFEEAASDPSVVAGPRNDG